MNLVPLAVALLAASAIGQISAGPFMACPMHHTVGGMTLGPPGLLPTGRIYLKRAGFKDLIVSPPYAPPRPVFTNNAMFGPPASLPASFRLGSISSGYHTVFATYTNPSAPGQPVVEVPMNAWGALIFSVSRNSPGTGVPTVATEAVQPEGAGADVFSYVLPGSMLPASLVGCVPIGVVQRATDSSEMGFQFAAGMKPELKDFDVFLPFYEVEGSLLPLLDPDPIVYFSLPTSVAADPIVANWFTMYAGSPVPAPHNVGSGATILRIRWNSATLTWSSPRVFATYADLGLASTDTIDALSVDEANARVLLSLSGAPLAQQLMVASYNPLMSSWIPAMTYLVDDGTDAIAPMAEKAGAGGGGDIDATCEPDPSFTTQGAGNQVAYYGFGYVVDCRTQLGATMASSTAVTASMLPANTTVAVSASGMTGTIGALLAGLPPPNGATATSFVALDVFVVSGATRTYDWTFPKVPAAYGISVDFQWLTLGGPMLELSTAVRGRF